MKRFNDWIDSLPDSVWIATLMWMSLVISYVLMGGLQ